MKTAFKKLLLLSFVAVTVLFGCSEPSADNNNVNGNEKPSLMVKFVNVGDGDSVFVVLPNGETLLIDCGVGSNETLTEIKNAMGVLEDKIDYLVLSHVDADHTGGAAEIIKTYGVKRAFLPKVLFPEPYISFNSALAALNECGAQTEISETNKTVGGEDWFFTFLSPDSFGIKNSPYEDFNSAERPSSAVINATSAVIYLKYKKISFLFTGDAGFKTETDIKEKYEIGLYNGFLNNKVTLENLTFIKIAHHGLNTATGKEFLRLTSPKNAVISCGGTAYGNPDTAVLKRINDYAPECKVFRTDICGTLSIFIAENGVITCNEQN